MTATDLKSRNVRDLASLAKKHKVPGWHAMRKEELVKVLLRRSRKEPPPRKSANHDHRAATEHKTEVGQIQAKLAQAKDLTFRTLVDGEEHVKDRLVVMVRDPYWLHAYWELSRKSIERAKAALGQNWHGARPILRVCEVLRDGPTSATRQHVRDIEIHGGVNNWYIDVHNPPKSFQLDIGYLALGGRFFCLARSNVVSTPPANNGESFDKNWADVAKDFDHIFRPQRRL